MIYIIVLCIKYYVLKQDLFKLLKQETITGQ